MSATQEVLFHPTVTRPAAAAPATTRTEMHMDIATVALPGGRRLHLAAMDGLLLLGDGYEGDGSLRSIARGLSMPVELWPTVRAELDRLAGAT
jgi:hypothetical protein